MEGITICRECEFAERIDPKLLSNEAKRSSYLLSQQYKSGMSGRCLSVDAPIEDYVYGFKHCTDINEGHCQFFKGRGEVDKR